VASGAPSPRHVRRAGGGHARPGGRGLGIVGLVDMAGVSKTALLKKFNNDLLINSHDINVTIEGDRLGVSWEKWTPKEHVGVMNFVLLLDDVWEPLLDDYRPPGMQSLKFRKFPLGNMSPKIEETKIQYTLKVIRGSPTAVQELFVQLGVNVDTSDWELKPLGCLSVTVATQDKFDHFQVTVADWGVQAIVSRLLSGYFHDEDISIIAKEDDGTLASSDGATLLQYVVEAVNGCLVDAPNYGRRFPEKKLGAHDVIPAIRKCSSTGGLKGRF
jgi:hypothetical protein